MELRTLEDLKELAKDKERFLYLLDLCGDRLQFLNQSFGFDFYSLYNKMPETEEEIYSRFFECCKKGKNVLNYAIGMLFEYIELGLEKERMKKKMFYDDTLENRIKKKKLNQEPNKYLIERGIILEEDINRFMHEYEVTRKDYFKADIKGEEVQEIAEKYGKAAVLNSLSEDEKNETLCKIEFLKNQLNNLKLEERLHPCEIKQKFPDIYSLAKELFGRYEWALIELCGHSLRQFDIDEISNRAYKIFIDFGEQEARNYLKKFKIKNKVVETLMIQYAQIISNYRGTASGIFSSELEKAIENELVKRGIFFRRHVKYKEFGKTDKNYRMDFLIGNTIIEVIDEEDDFIHNNFYFERLREKELIAKEAGKSFILLKKDDFENKDNFKDEKLIEVMKEAIIPAHLYHLGIFEIKNDNKNDNIIAPSFINTIERIVHKQKIFFYRNRFMIGYIKKRIA